MTLKGSANQLELQLIPHEAQGLTIAQRGRDGYINATALCQAAGKKWSHYAGNTNTKEFIAELATDAGIPATELIQSLSGGIIQGTWVHPQVAIHLAQWCSPKFAVMVSKWVYDWMSGKNKPAAAKLPDYFNRYVINNPKIPVGFFSILQMTAMDLFGPLHHTGFDFPAGWTPDISVGLQFCKYLRNDHAYATTQFQQYPHEYCDGRPAVMANLYPDSLLAIYKNWFATVYLPTHMPEYVKRKDASLLPQLNKHPLLAAPKTTVAKNLPWRQSA